MWFPYFSQFCVKIAKARTNQTKKHKGSDNRIQIGDRRNEARVTCSVLRLVRGATSLRVKMGLRSFSGRMLWLARGPPRSVAFQPGRAAATDWRGFWIYLGLFIVHCRPTLDNFRLFGMSSSKENSYPYPNVRFQFGLLVLGGKVSVFLS